MCFILNSFNILKAGCNRICIKVNGVFFLRKFLFSGLFVFSNKYAVLHIQCIIYYVTYFIIHIYYEWRSIDREKLIVGELIADELIASTIYRRCN